MSSSKFLIAMAIAALTQVRDKVDPAKAAVLDDVIATLTATFLGGISPQFGGGGGPR